MTTPIDLPRLHDSAQAAPPFDFEQFERRRAHAEQQRRATVWSVTGSMGVLCVVGLLALLTQAPQPAAPVMGTAPAGNLVQQAEAPYQPALVDIGRFDVTSNLEDHIALLDAQISAARAYAVPAEQLRQLESTREQLNVSLQRVSYAQTLLSF